MKDRDVLFHAQWLGLAQPVEGLVFSVPVLADAQIAPEVRPELTTAFTAHVDASDPPRIKSAERLFRDLLGFDQPGMLVRRDELPADLSFYAAEGGQEIRPSYALGRGPFATDDPFATFAETTNPVATREVSGKPVDRWFALVWDLTEAGESLDLDAPEAATGPWRYPPTAKLERLLRHVGVPIGFLFNGQELRLVYAPSGESTAHLTFRVAHLVRPDGRPLLAALDLLLHARRAYTASPEHTLEGLLAESRRRQADVTDELAKQVFEAVEILVAGFEAAAARDIGGGDRIDWLRAALEEEGDHFYQGVLSIVLRLVFLLYAEDQSLLPVEHPTYAEHLSLAGLYARLSHDAGAHPESMHHRFGAYGQLLSLFRSVFFGVKHGSLDLPPRRGRLFDPNAFPFLEGGLPGWTAAVVDHAARADAQPPSIDDGTIYRVLHRLVVFEGQRLSYRTLDVEQIGSVYESLMGYHVLRLTSPAVRIGKYGVWVEADDVRAMTAAARARFFKDTCGLDPEPAQSLEQAIAAAADTDAVIGALSLAMTGKKVDGVRHRANAGRVLVQPGEERRRTATHYTPRSLTERIVRRTLKPVLACLGSAPTSEQVLQLKICDPTMGSGAFLVGACRELATEVVAAWTREGSLAGIIEEHGDAHLHARRLVAQQCLYGVDKNPAAVELAKLSLWLVTLSKALPFTFVDHAFRHGDSLVGLDFKQIESFHWAPARQTETCTLLLREAFEQAIDLRQEILKLAEREDPASQWEKRRLFDFAQQAIERVRTAADLCVGAFFTEATDAAREKERCRRLGLLELWLSGDVDAAADVKALVAETRAQLSPFHWWIEFPEVFFDERPDPLDGAQVNRIALVDAFVGNPPFVAQKDLSGRLGEGYRDWLLFSHPGAGGKSNIVAHFFRRAANLLGRHGALGFVATDKIREGDTRESSLQYLLQHGFTISDAVPTMPWPGKASLAVAIVVMVTGNPAHAAVADVQLEGRVVGQINSRLKAEDERTDPKPLAANNGLSYRGCELSGSGFIVNEAERRDLLNAEPHAAERLFLYVKGEDVNARPPQDLPRWVIDFGERSLEEAAHWPVLLDRLSRLVREERERVGRRPKWWRFAEVQPAMRAAIAGLDRCLVMARDPQHFCFSFQPTAGRVFNEKLYVFPVETYCFFAVLQSRIHVEWAIREGRTTGASGTHSYSNNRCFKTFPFPEKDPRTMLVDVEAAGRALYVAREKYMAATNQGLTKTYNALKDVACVEQRIVELRALHEEVDRAVLDAYGWNDVAVPPYCATDEKTKTASLAFEAVVVERLYGLNVERAREEARVGRPGTKRRQQEAEPATTDVRPRALAQSKRPKKQRAKPEPTQKRTQGKLFDEGN